LPLSVIKDYEQYEFSFDQIKRINRYWMSHICFFLLERILFKFEKWFRKKIKI